MQRLGHGAVSLLGLATHRVVATHGPATSLHFRSRPPPHPSVAGVQGEVTPDSPVFRHMHTLVRLCGAAASRSFGISVRTLCWLPSLWGDCPPHLLSTSYLHLCPFLKWDIFSSPTDSSSTFLMVLMRTSKPIISGPASPRAPDLQPNLACLGALSSRPPSLDCSRMPTPEVFPPTCISHPLDLLLNIISSKTFPDHIIYSSLCTLSSQLLLTHPGHGDHHMALDLLRHWLISEAHTLRLAHLSIPGPMVLAEWANGCSTVQHRTGAHSMWMNCPLWGHKGRLQVPALMSYMYRWVSISPR